MSWPMFGSMSNVSNIGHDISHLLVAQRSEEHTSELQSQSNLVCRLLLEKKKNNQQRLHLGRPVSTSLSGLFTPPPSYGSIGRSPSSAHTVAARASASTKPLQ